MYNNQPRNQSSMFRGGSNYRNRGYQQTQGIGRVKTDYQRYQPQPQYQQYQPQYQNQTVDTQEDKQSKRIKDIQESLWNKQMSLVCLPGGIPTCYMYMSRYIVTDYTAWNSWWTSLYKQARVLYLKGAGLETEQRNESPFTWGTRPLSTGSLCDINNEPEKVFSWIWQFILSNIAPFNELREDFKKAVYQAKADEYIQEEAERIFNDLCEKGGEQQGTTVQNIEDKIRNDTEYEDTRNKIKERVDNEYNMFEQAIDNREIGVDVGFLISFLKGCITTKKISPHGIEAYYNNNQDVINIKTGQTYSSTNFTYHKKHHKRTQEVSFISTDSD